MKIQKNISLAQYTTFKIGGPAKYFLQVKTIEDLKEGVNFALQNSLPLFILGGGSNLLVSDCGFGGLVIKVEIKGIKFEKISGGWKVTTGAGENWDKLVEKTVEKGLVGLENLSLIPGTVGASVVQNIGAFGREVKDLVFDVKVFDLKTFEIKRLKKSKCQLKYRDSFFKSRQGRNLVVTEVVFVFKNKAKLDYDYLGLKDVLLDSKITVQDVRNAIIRVRKKRYPLVGELGSAGCFFKNSIIEKSEFKKIKKVFPDIIFYDLPDGKVKIPIAWLIEKLGWKGYRKNNVGVYKNHSLILINYGRGTAEGIKNLADKISKDIFEKTNLKIFNEVIFLE